MNIKDYLDKNNLHHAYLIEGKYEEVSPAIFDFLNEINIDTTGNPDFSEMMFDSFKIDDARNLKSKSSEKGFSNNKKIYIISANNFLLEAQNTLLKMFEEPIPNTHFFLVVPDTDVLLKTLISRFYLIKIERNTEDEEKNAQLFIKMQMKDRISFIKEILTEEDEEEGILNTDTPRSKALIFLNALEIVLHKKMSKTVFDTSVFEHIFKIREFLRQPGSSAKSLMESVAIVVPNL
ncbi:MAG: hypothetical protein WCI41_03320 [bacterium]